MRIHDYVDEIACDLLGGVGMYENAFNGLSLHAFNEATLPQAHDIFWTLPFKPIPPGAHDGEVV